MSVNKRFLFISFVMLLMISTQSSAQRKILFNDNWNFHLGKVSTTSQNDLNSTEWRMIDLPHDWSIEGKFDVKNPMGNDGGYLPAGIGWYRKNFEVPAKWKGKKVTIYFEGVYMNAEVFINGKSLGIYPYGFSPFSYDISPYLEFSKKNYIAVKVDNSLQKNCRWYTGSGIYRHVWMIVTDPLHIAEYGVSVETPGASDKEAAVLVKTTVKNETSQAQKFILNTIISGKGTKSVSKAQTSVEIAANSKKEISQTITITKPRLWAPETPDLYQAKVQIKKGNKITDETLTNFGIRTLNYSVENGFQLNGKTIKLNGGCIHSDNGCLGSAAFNRAEERKAELLKNAGFNAVRTAHNIPSEAFLNACDRLGLLVIDEAFDGWRTGKNKYDYSLYFDNWSIKDLETMVLRDRNHPSVIMWSIGNEIIERKEPEAVETAGKLANAVRKIDTSRPVTSAMTTWDKDWEIFDPLMAKHDVCGYNYELYRAPVDHIRVPSRIVLQTESYPRDAFKNWKLASENSYIIGDFVWTAMDYLGESGIGRWYYTGDVPGEHYERNLYPWHAAYCGDIDLTGQRKPISYYRELLYNGKNKLYFAVREPNPEPLQIIETRWSVWPTWECWNWPGYEGKNIQVEVYSRYPKVRLFLNNELVGENETTESQQFKAVFTLPYQEGVLKAVGIENGKEMESKTLQTAGEASNISLKADRTTISADGQDLSFITIEILDKNGIRQPNANNRLEFSISGPGVIAGVDNADIKDLDSYAGNSRKAWKGKALLVIRSTKKPGVITLHVSSKGLKEAGLTIKSE